MQNQVSTATFSSVQEFSAALDGFGWVTDFRQLSPGAEEVNVDAIQSDTVLIQRVGFASAVHQRVLPPPGYLTFGIPTHAQPAGRMGRRPLESETITRFSESSGFDVVSFPGFSAYTLSLEKERLTRLAEHMELVDPNAKSSLKGMQKIPDGESLARLRHLLGTYLEVNKATVPPRVKQNMVRQFEAELATSLLAAWCESEIVPYVRPSNRSRSLKRALDYLYTHPDKVITVEQLCYESACSISTLERAFREHFGVTPKRYLLAMRLTEVRRSLLKGGELRNVADVAAEWGFWHMSKFAADYKRMFGELPSVTRSAV